MERITLFADVLLPLPLDGVFTYRVPFELNEAVKEGIRVVVQFGSKKIYTGLILKLHEKPPSVIPKYILSLLDEDPVVNPMQLSFWQWMASYYLCFPGEIMNAALPAALKLASESRIILHPGIEEIPGGLNEKEALLLEALMNRKAITVSEISGILGFQKTIPVVKGLMEKGFILPEEELRDVYKPLTEHFVTLGESYSRDEEALAVVFDQLEKKAKRQLEILMTWVRLSRFGFDTPLEVRRKELLDHSGGNAGQLGELVKKGILKVKQRVINRLETGSHDPQEEPAVLSEVQETALARVKEDFARHDVVLLHGVTSSGKTEVYISLIRETLAQGRQVLLLLPEIALTTQIINRLRRQFGNRVGVYHSRFNVHERVDIYRAVLTNKSGGEGFKGYDIILGARSSVFLPFDNLGLVIVDEEHDASYKQSDPAPRYNGRDSAVYLARLHDAKVLLGSATPSIESYRNAVTGKYGLVEMAERYAGLEMPLVEVVNIREAAKRGGMKSHFSQVLLDNMKRVFDNGEQAILFQNRRGFSLRLECETCHWMPSCKNCDVTLVYHKKSNQLRCHYCGYISGIPEKCPECRGVNITMKGFGTEKVEEELAILFPGKRIVRMDLDTTRSRHALEMIISDFEARRIDVLVGTQMVTKGLDFDNVSLVCILNADNMLSYPDFRSAERSFQMMAQVSGRSGRKNKQGMVIIQTRKPDHLVIRQVVAHDYRSMFAVQQAERLRFKYPPFCRMILLKLKHREQDALATAASKLGSMLRKEFGDAVLGPEYPMVSRVMNLYIKHIIIKMDRGNSLAKQKQVLLKVMESFRTDTAARQVRIIIDVDPQ